jgi:hypothetical protein
MHILITVILLYMIYILVKIFKRIYPRIKRKILMMLGRKVPEELETVV